MAQAFPNFLAFRQGIFGKFMIDCVGSRRYSSAVVCT